MEPYEEEVYNFLTQIENYRASKQLADQIPQVEDQLRKGFWKLVEDNLRKRIINTDFSLELAYPNTISLIYKNIPNLKICCDQLNSRPDYGIFAPKDNFDRNIVEKIINEIGINDKKSSKPTDGCPYFSFIGYDFRSSTTIENILPINRDIMVESIANILFNFMENHLLIFERIANEALKK